MGRRDEHCGKRQQAGWPVRTPVSPRRIRAILAEEMRLPDFAACTRKAYSLAP